MSASAVAFTKLIIDSMWKLATAWKLPGLNMSPATFIFGCIIFGLALRGLGDFLVMFGVKPFETGYQFSYEDLERGTEYWYQQELQGYYDRRS